LKAFETSVYREMDSPARGAEGRAPLRILYLVDSLRVGGKERQLCELVKGIEAGRYAHQTVVTMGSEQFYVPAIQKLGVPLHYLLRSVRWDPTVLPRLFKILRQVRPQIILTNSEMSMSYALPLAKLMGIKVVNATIRNAFSGQGLRWRWHMAMLQLADIRVGNSKAGFLSRGLRPDAPGNYVIYNGFDMQRMGRTPGGFTGPALRAGNEKVVGMVAEFNDYKDFPTFIRAAQWICERRNDVTFVAVGGGKNLEACQAIASNEPRIQFLGPREDVESIVQQIDIGVLCTFTEGISNSVMELMAAAKPVIVTDGGGSSELVGDGEHGFLVKTSDVAAVAEKISFLLDNPSKARQMGAAGRQRIQNCFSLEALTESHIALFKDVVKNLEPL
jgi:glycosyltransferase involved in cell wall biosynthesis